MTNVIGLSEGVYALEQEMVRCFLVVGEEKALLLDTGAEPCDLIELIRGITELPLVVVHSHGDGDHTENDGQFDQIYAHPAEESVIHRFRPKLKAELLPLPEAFDLGGRVLSVIEAPGHTPGSICLLDRENRILFSGDSVSYGPVFLFGDHRDIATYRKTLDILEELGGFDTVYPCHNTCPVGTEVIGQLKAAVDGALAGTISPENTDMPLPDGMEVYTYRVGNSGILYCETASGLPKHP